MAQSNYDGLVQDMMRKSAKDLAEWQKSNPPPAQATQPSPRKLPASPERLSTQTQGALDSLVGKVAPTTNAGKGRATQDNELITTYYFVSFSMPAPVLADTLRSLGDNEVAVFRGIAKGKTMADFIQKLSLLLGKPKENDRPYNIQVDPTRYRKCGIKQVPATCIFTASGPQAVHGILSGDYLKRRGQGNSASLGQTWDIAENDLADELRNRLSKATKEDVRQATVKQLFVAREYVQLPRATQSAAFEFDPSVIRQEPIVLAGKVISHKGHEYNPIGTGFTQSYMVIDATDPPQVQVAQRMVPYLAKLGRNVSVIVSDFPNHSNGFEAIARLRKQFKTRVTLLDRELARALRLRALPAVVESTKTGKIIINEVQP